MKRFTLFLGLFVCLCIGKAWGYEDTINESNIKSSQTQNVSHTEGNVTFLFENFAIGGLYSVTINNGSTAKVSWTPPIGYSMSVSSTTFRIYTATAFNHCSLTIKDSKNNSLYYNGNVNTSSAAVAFWTTCTDLANDATYVTLTPGKTTASGLIDKTSSAGITDFKISYTLSPKTYSVYFNANGGSLGSSSVTATFDGAMPSASAPTRTGYTFDGYYDAVSGGKKYYNSDMSSANNWDKDAATTLYAHWTAKTYDVTLNDGLGNTSTVSATYGSAMPNTTKNGTDLSAPSKDSYLFIGYFDAESNGNQYYNSDMTSHQNWNKDQTNVTLYAQYASKLVPSAYLEGFSTNNSDSVLTLTAGTTASFTFINTDNIEVAVQNSSVISYSNGTITAIGAGESTITLTQAETETTAGRIFTYHITVVRNTTTLTQNVFSTKTNQILTIEDLFSWNGNGTVTWEIYDTNSSNAEMIDDTIYTYAECTLKIKVSYTETPQYTGISDREFTFEVTDIAATWKWKGSTPSNNKQYYIYTKNQLKYLNDANGWDATPTVLWTFSGSFGNESGQYFTLTSSNGKHLTMYREYTIIPFWTHYIKTDDTNQEGVNIQMNTAKDNETGYYSLYRANKTENWDTDRNLHSTLSFLDKQNDASYEFLWITQDEIDAKQYYFDAQDAIQTLVSTYSGEEVDALKVAMVSVLAENDYNSSNSYSERVTNLKEVIANCNSFVAAETHEYTLTVSAAGWSSLCLPFDATLPTDDGFVAYYARPTDGSSITLTPITDGSIKAGEAIIVSAPAGDYVFEDAEDEPSKIESNILQGVTKSSTFESGSIYVLAGVDEDGPFFAPLVAEANAEDAVLPANKAYLQLTAGVAAPQVFTLVVEENTTTDMQEMSADVPTRKIYRNGQVLIIRGEEIYDMMGRRIQ